MYSRQLKTGYFVIEGLNSFATIIYFYYFYFFMQKQFGFGDRANLILAAANGGCYAIFAWAGGKFAQRTGYLKTLKIGLSIVVVALLIGSQLHTAAGHVAVMLVATLGVCLTWVTLEALASEGETRSGLQHMVGVYNVTWAATGSVAYFIGGALLDRLGLRSMFWVPIGILSIQLGMAFWLESISGRSNNPGTASALPVEEPHPHSQHRAENFLRMAWLANPFAYIAINTLIAVMPGVALRLELTTTAAGFCASIWCFSRLAAFTALWLWEGWHYRFRWLWASFLAMIATFAAIVTAQNLASLVVAQLVFGVATGLIYYSSLFYSMDVGETKGEHGGFHESAIGMGNFAGPAVGALSLTLWSGNPFSGAIAVSGLLLTGFCGLLALWKQGRT
jgi:predicted MFS family arabinose efflux permease